MTLANLGVSGIHNSPSTTEIAWDPAINDMELLLSLSEYATGPPTQDIWPNLGSPLSLGHGDSDHQPSPSFTSPQQTLKIPFSSENISQSILVDLADAPALPLPSSAENEHKMERVAEGNDTGVSKPGFSWNNTSIFAASLTANISNLEAQSIDLPQELARILCEYPRLMLQHQFWSPFIHHNLYRCSQNGMAEPLGIALACVSAHAGSVESSFEFVETMINTQRERLVRDFRLFIDRPETCLAALHAVCIYQILGLFEQHSAEGGSRQHREDSRKAAELHSSFLLKMTRFLCRLHKKALEGGETGWSEWKFIESLRRNMFFVHVVNILAAKTQRLHYDYFEPLDDDMILKMPLPAPECTWRACSEEEWGITREYSHSISPNPCTLQDLINSSHVGALDVSSLQPLTRIILECHKIRPNRTDEGM
ncbi:hypothetical protein N7540_010929 [Penicillium herquei]|nr:hypothetical protein N7540_010929 [Penicillium herquei]